MSTQDSVDEGRTDIILEWPSGYRLALELKTLDPPEARQVEQYLRSKLDVIAIAKLAADLEITAPLDRRFFGVITWTRVREVDWDGAPLEVRQLHKLLDATGVVMPKLTEAALEGMLVSWNTWDALQAWSRKGAEAVQIVLARGGLTCVQQDKPGQHIKVDMTHQRLAWWMWPPPWGEDALAVYAGLFMGRPNDPVTSANLPDLLIALHVNPASQRGARLRGDAAWTTAAEHWASRAPDGVTREYRPSNDVWDLLRCRASSREIVSAEDPGMAMIKWMSARAQEWVDDGIAKRLAELVNNSKGRTA